MQPDSSITQQPDSSNTQWLISPQNRDSILQTLEGNLAGPLEDAALISFYRYLRGRENKVGSSDRKFYSRLRARFEEKLTARKLEIPDLFKIEQPVVKDSGKTEKKPVETTLKKDAAPNSQASVKKTVVVKALEVPIKYNIRFAEHMTFPDGSVVNVGDIFVKQWEVVNPSDETVPVTCKIKSFASNNLAANHPVSLLEEIKPGESAWITVKMQAPAAPGTYTDYFRFISSTGKEFGDTFSCRIIVKLK